jgi:hypothetical protein
MQGISVSFIETGRAIRWSKLAYGAAGAPAGSHEASEHAIPGTRALAAAKAFDPQSGVTVWITEREAFRIASNRWSRT